MVKRGEYERAIALIQICVDYLRDIQHPDAEAGAARLEQLRQYARGETEAGPA